MKMNLKISGLLKSLLGSSKSITCITIITETSVLGVSFIFLGNACPDDHVYIVNMFTCLHCKLYVSSNLAKTLYVKMIDIWFIINLLLPSVRPSVHTFMDTLR